MFSRLDHDDAEETPADLDTRSFIPLPLQQDREDTAIRSAINGQDPLVWPDVSGPPMSEFSVKDLASLCFPALLPYGRGDPSCKARRCEVSLSEAFKHLIKYADLDPSGLIRWRFSISRSRRFQERLSEEDRLHTLARLAATNVPNSN